MALVQEAGLFSARRVVLVEEVLAEWRDKEPGEYPCKVAAQVSAEVLRDIEIDVGEQAEAAGNSRHQEIADSLAASDADVQVDLHEQVPAAAEHDHNIIEVKEEQLDFVVHRAVVPSVDVDDAYQQEQNLGAFGSVLDHADIIQPAEEVADGNAPCQPHVKQKYHVVDILNLLLELDEQAVAQGSQNHHESGHQEGHAVEVIGLLLFGHDHFVCPDPENQRSRAAGHQARILDHVIAYPEHIALLNILARIALVVSLHDKSEARAIERER